LNAFGVFDRGGSGVGVVCRLGYGKGGWGCGWEISRMSVCVRGRGDLDSCRVFRLVFEAALSFFHLAFALSLKDHPLTTHPSSHPFSPLLPVLHLIL